MRGVGLNKVRVNVHITISYMPTFGVWQWERKEKEEKIEWVIAFDDDALE